MMVEGWALRTNCPRPRVMKSISIVFTVCSQFRLIHNKLKIKLLYNNTITAHTLLQWCRILFKLGRQKTFLSTYHQHGQDGFLLSFYFFKSLFFCLQKIHNSVSYYYKHNIVVVITTF